MTEPDYLVDLEGVLSALPDAIDAKRLGDSLTRSLAALRTSDRQIERIGAVLELAREIKFGDTQVELDMVEELRNAAFATGDDLEHAETAPKLDKATYAYENDLGRSLTNLDRNLSRHWRLIVTRQFEPLLAIGNLLTRIDADSDLGAQLAACGASARGTPDALGGRSLLDHVRGLLKERDRLQARRRDELGEGDVAQFVNALAEDRASLAMVTPEVSAWLQENHALGKLKVRPAL